MSFGFHRKRTCGFELKKDSVVDDHVNALRGNPATFVPNRNSYFSSNGPVPFKQFNLESVCVNTFEETISQRVVDLKKCLNNVAGCLSLEENVTSHCETLVSVRHLTVIFTARTREFPR